MLSSEMVSTSASTSISGFMPVKVSYADIALSRPTSPLACSICRFRLLELDRVAVHDANLAEAGCSHVDGDDGAQATRSGYEDACPLQLLLASLAKEANLAGVSLFFGII